MSLKRHFSTSSPAYKVGCSIVEPVHHLVKIDKRRLSPRFPELKYEKNDIRSSGFKPTVTHQDRVQEHYYHTVQPDLLLMAYKHGATTVKGAKARRWDGSSPYHVNRKAGKPAGAYSETADQKPITPKNIPQLSGLTVSSFVKEAKDNRLLQISSMLQLQQITGVKPKRVLAKTNVVSWKLKAGKVVGAKVHCKGRPASQFLATLSEIVLPRVREYNGIYESNGDKNGNITIGMTPEDVENFPEIEANQDLWPHLFGMHVNINTTARNDDHAKMLISGFGLPFTRGKKN
ncbi:hypothetical protein ACO0RG_002685 [Hanseniaspora osmophila]|uniref:54S ribosomal protein L7, mitochondrial n=1 Tax=Hanseniaspora osmophila TaxID=56408 RepID=A0A1E5R7I3_9ASCO|nr:54S ribosomal protein L7, mitochondrial [Hanseniaspora osmophila]